MSNSFFNVSGTPGTRAQGSSATMRAEFALIAAGFDKLPVLAGNGGKVVGVNAGATALDVLAAINALPIGTTTPAAGAFTTLSASGALTAASITGPLTGNASTATALATPRTINGVSFDGTANIVVADATKAPLTGAGASGTWGISISGSAPASGLTGATLPTGITASSLTSVGTLTSLSMSGPISGATDLTTTSNTILGNALGDTLNVANGAFKVFSDGRVSGNKLHNIGTVTGTTDQYIASGTYTPTLTNGSNVAASTPLVSQWLRVGNVVTVSGSLQIDPTTAGVQVVVGISLPIPSVFVTGSNLAGTAHTVNVSPGWPGAIQAEVLGSRAGVGADPLDNVNREYSFTFTYVVL